MTQEEKELLLKDLCARLPYGVICQHLKKLPDWLEACNVTGDYEFNFKLGFGSIQFLISNIETAKPYLRPMSSMTEEEEKEYCRLVQDTDNGIEPITNLMEWLDAHHFDYRGLIPMHLALEAPEDMYILCV